MTKLSVCLKMICRAVKIIEYVYCGRAGCLRLREKMGKWRTGCFTEGIFCGMMVSNQKRRNAYEIR